MLEEALRFAFEKLNKEQLVNLAIQLIIDGLHTAGRKNKKEEPKILINLWKSPELTFKNVEEADKVGTYLINLLKEQKRVSLSDLYEFLGFDSTFSDSQKGWVDLLKMRIVKTPDGFKLLLPSMQEFEDL